MTEQERTFILAAAVALGFEYNKDTDRLICTSEQLMQLSVLIASVSLDQMNAHVDGLINEQ